MSSMLRSSPILAIAIVLASCAQPQKVAAAVKAAPTGSSFDQVGKVTFYVGQPCTSQIMFVFHAPRSTSTVWLAAPMRETKMLTEAAKRQRRVHVWGKWRRAKTQSCSYVEATQVEMQKWFW
jgi:poly-gamma-glutamate capsule biosynthesis protein CapA/YwtB (metallophosphatase superfamily)